MPALLQRREELLRQLIGHVKPHVAETDWPQAEIFLDSLLQDFALDDVRRYGPEYLGAMALSLFRRLQERKLATTEITLNNPREHDERAAYDHTIIEILRDDSPFLVDSITELLKRRGLEVHIAVHPQLSVQRDADGRLVELLAPGSDGDGVLSESLMHFEVERHHTATEMLELETALNKVLGDVDTAVGDWSDMRAACCRALEHLNEQSVDKWGQPLVEVREFLDWLADDHFTFLGYREYKLVDEDGRCYLRPLDDTGLGLLRKLPLDEQVDARRPITSRSYILLKEERLLHISKSVRHSTVHRDVHMDLVSIKHFDANGDINGELRFIGLFTSRAYSIAASDIPLVRDKVRRVVERTGFLSGAHRFKVLNHIVENYPRDELFQISEDDLYVFSLRILSLQLRPRLALLVRKDEEERFVSCMVHVPKERQSTRNRRKLQAILEHTFGGEVSASYIRIGDRPLAQLLFVIDTKPGHIPDYDVEEVERRLDHAILTWADRLRSALREQLGGAGREVWERFGEAFSSGYQEHNSVDEAIADIPLIRDVLERGQLRVRFSRREGAAENRFHLRTFELAVSRHLSELLPILENMGLRVVNERPHQIRPTESSNPVWMRDFEVETVDDADLESVLENFEEALRRVYRGDVENDLFNRLVIAAGLEWRQVVLLRAYCKYLRQTGVAFSQYYMQTTMAAHPEIARLLVDLFHVLFDPARQDGIDREQLLLGEIYQSLDKVSRIDRDRILRRYLNVVQSTLRTNFFQLTDDGSPKPYLSIKLDGLKVAELPAPRPMFEIFVYSPRMEAVHLRGGKVARGGIRWSDRREDFRTEILGLVKSQMVKNTVIVPVGAKGGFVVKQPPKDGDRDAHIAEGIECYKTMVRGLLDVTDNLVAGEVVPPTDVVRRDEDDTYLVVAADKGTATFSDIANSLSEDYGFWLGDAFASGGSKGYDHKGMGITARGAWESVKRHFRELGRDIQREPFTCVGVGDMSGDVFGNGMLLSKHCRLVAAFNHLHIFVDPDPRKEAFAERKRLFELPRSSWTDFDTSKLSAGGAIFERSAKRLTVSAEIKERFGLPTDTMAPSELIQAILRAKIDLLWFGGIGTYVRATDEANSEVGDRSNDEIRVTAGELQCLTVGEGANLGLTQLGRVEYALGGGRLNTDFIDNSGGVDCSDHEVNMKIALGSAVEAGDIDMDERDRMLVDMTDDVSRLVLRDNYLQSQALSLELAQKRSLLDDHVRLMNVLARKSGLDRQLEQLPNDATLAERKEKKQGMTRPEISVLLAHAKMAVYNDLLESDLPDDPSRTRDLVSYFPSAMKKRLRRHLESHRLRRELIATHVTNSMVNRMGTTYVNRLVDETGRRVADIARAYTAARDVFELRDLWNLIERLDNKVAAEMQSRMMQIANGTLADLSRWFLRHGGHPFNLGEVVRRYQDGMVVVAAQLEDLLAPNAKGKVRRRFKRLVDKGVPEDVASRIATMDLLPSACDVARSAAEAGGDVERMGRIYFTLGERLGFDRFRRAAEQLPNDSIYLQSAVTALLDDFSNHQTDITRQVADHDGRARAAIKAWSETRPDAVARLDRLRQELDFDSTADLAVLTIAERELRRLVSM
ncbi:MAG: NAD-glutamate dehydrogenase [Acidobacteriota bacterium]